MATVSGKRVVGKYERVGEKRGPLVIGGARKKMEQDPNFVYEPTFGIAGPREDVEKYLQEHHPKEAKSALKSCYSATNLKKKDVREAFESEVENAQRDKLESNRYKQQIRDVNLDILGTFLESYDEERRNGSHQVTTVAMKVASELKAKVKALSDGDKVLDITNMKSKGMDTKKVVFNEKGKKRRLSQVKGDPFYNVVYDASSKSSASGIKNFLKLYGFDDDRIAKTCKAVREGHKVNIARGKSPTRSPMLSPKKRSRRRATDVDDLLE